jgi:hypothetical protein
LLIDWRCLDNLLYVGRDDGIVALFKVIEQDGYIIIEHVRENNVSSKMPITFIEYIPSTQLLVMIKDGKLVVTDENLERLNKSAKNWKNLELLATDHNETLSRIAIVEKGKHLIVADITKASQDLLCEHTSHNTIVCLKMLNNIVYFGTKRQYKLMEVPSGDISETAVPIEGATPLLDIWENQELIVSSLSSLLIFLNLDGTPSSRSTIQCSRQPLSIAVSKNFVLALVPGEQIEIFNILDDMSHVQTQKISFAKYLTVDPKGMQLGLVWNEDTVDYMREFPTVNLIQQYLDSMRIERATGLLYKTDPTAEQVMKFHTQAGYSLFRNMEFLSATQHFMKAATDPRELIAMFPDIVSAIGMDYKKVVQPDISAPKDINAAIREGKELREKKMTESKDQEVLEASPKKLIERACIALSDFLWKWRQANFSKLSVSPANDSLLESVDSTLLVLLVDLGGRQDAYVTRRGKKGVEEEPLATYTPRDLLFPKNYCNLAKMELYLSARQHFNTLALLWLTKNQPRKALAGFRKLSSGEWVDPGFFGVSETIEILQSLEDSPLLWEYVEWVLYEEPSSAISVFVEPKRKDEVPPEKVLKVLVEIEDKIVKAKKGDKPNLVNRYLHYLVFDKKAQDEKYHNQLALVYLKSYQKAVQGNASEDTKAAARSDLRKLLFESERYDARGLLSYIKELELWDELCVLYSRLALHSEMLELCVYNLKDHQRAWQYCSNAGQVVDDSKSSPQDDNRYRTKQEIQKCHKLFSTLLRIYCNPDAARLPPTESRSSYLKLALTLFQQYSSIINPVDVLKYLPEEVPIASLSKPFERMIPPLIHRKRTTLITKNLSSAENLTTSLSLHVAKRRFFLITPERVCPVCKTPLGDKIFRGYPDGQAVHYHCDAQYNARLQK